MDNNIEITEDDICLSTIKYLEERKERIDNGLINTVPSPFLRFSNDFIGFEPSTYYVVTSYTKGGKSQFVSFLLFESLLYCYYNEKNTQVSLKVLYFPLEETPTRITIRMYSWLLNRLFGIRVSPSVLRSVSKEHPLTEEVLEKLKDPVFQDIAHYIMDHIVFSAERNPTGIWKFCKKYAESHGKTLMKKSGFKVDGVEKEVKDKYVPDNPNEYVMVLIDTINLIDSEKDASRLMMTKKQAIDKMSEYLAMDLRNFYGYSPIVIQQQNVENESIDSVKMGRTRPSIAGLGDSKYTGRDCNIALGIFSPFKFGLDTYLADSTGIQYDIRKLKDNFRTLEVLINRDGSTGGIIGLYFDGATTTWKELPLPSDREKINAVYKSLM